MIEYISVQGKERPFLICMRGIVELWEGEKSMEEMTIMEMIDKITFNGFKHGYRAEKEKIDFTLEDVQSWLDANMELYGVVAEKYKKAQPLVQEVQKKMMDSGLIAMPATSQNGQEQPKTLNRSQKRKAERAKS